MVFYQVTADNFTTVWFHNLDANEMLGEKARWELYKDAVLNKSREQHYKTAVLWPLTSHLTNHPNKMNKTKHCWKSKDKVMSKVLWNYTHTHTHTPVLVNQQKLISTSSLLTLI